MIDPKDLRIGNLVEPLYNEVSNFHTVVLGITDMQILVPHEGIPKWYLTGLFRPIPITEEWLERLGFEKRDTRLESVYRKGIFEYATSCKTIDLEIKDSEHYICYTTDIKFVNQLQNLYFSLTGQELDVTKLITINK